MDSKLFFTCIFLFFLSWGLQCSADETPEQMELKQSLDTLGQGIAGLVQQANQESQNAAFATTAATSQAANSAATSASNSADSLACMQKLMPCQPFMHSPSPPPICCTPLKEMVSKESQCLCGVFDNPELLKTVNLTIDEALAIPKACSIDVDVSVCKKKATSPSTAPSATGTSSNSNTSSDSRNSSSSSSEDSNGGVRISEGAIAGYVFWFIASVGVVLF